MRVLGLSAHYHDSAAALVDDTGIVAAVQEERFSRKKHDARFPHNAIEACLREGGITLRDVDQIVYYDKPLLKFERLLESYLASAPAGLPSFLMSMPLWMKEKLYLKSLLKKEFTKLAGCKPSELPPVLFTEHHQSHAASAFFPSPFERAAVLCLDGVGEWATASAWLGEGNTLTAQWELDFPHSLGLLYSAFTYYTGFKVNSGEYKLMGLAPYGEPTYAKLIRDHLIDIKPDGTFRLDMSYFNYTVGLTMTNDKFHALFGGPPRKGESPLTQMHMDLARSIQLVTEEVVLKLAHTVKTELGVENLCMAGGVALNCVANGRVQRESGFKGFWIQPAAGDAGGALGAALAGYHQYGQGKRTVHAGDAMRGSYLGPKNSDAEIQRDLDAAGAKYVRLDDDVLLPRLAELLATENVIGWVQGKMEFGPRALGGRSILGDPRSPAMQSVMNLKIKYRESFRPFAPAVLAEEVSNYFTLNEPSPYMLLVAPVNPRLKIATRPEDEALFGIDKLKVPRSQLPAITHVDDSARVQTVHDDTNPRFAALLRAFQARTGCPVLINTSFNVRGEPIVATAADSYRCFMRTEMDALVVENFLIMKADQPVQAKDEAWKREFELD
jgi:carbamoyltransferase